MIIKEKRFPGKLIKDLEYTKSVKTKNDKTKKFLGTVHANVSKRHRVVKNVFKQSIIDKEKYYLPADMFKISKVYAIWLSRYKDLM